MMSTLKRLSLLIPLSFVLAFGVHAQGAKMNAKEAVSNGYVTRPSQNDQLNLSEKTGAEVKKAVVAPSKGWKSLELIKSRKLSPLSAEAANIHGHYIVTCLDKTGKVKWEESFDNVVTTVGKNLTLDNILNTSATASTNVYMGLKGTGTAVIGDTMASHASWSELNITASSGARLAPTFSAASSGSKTTSSAVSFSITAAGPTTVAGVFIVLGSTAVVTNGSTAGTLFSAGDFASSRSVVSGDTLNVTYTASL
jgi:hypothetical protein